jgi:hypothetical protein
MRLTFRGAGLTRVVAYRDNVASSCHPVAPFVATGTGLIGSVFGEGKFITVSLIGRCVRGATVALADAKYMYDFTTDTLRGPLDLAGNNRPDTVDWHRG